MDAKQCDRCGSFYNKDVCDPRFVVGKQTRMLNFTNGVFEPSTKGLDLCPECQAAFERWMDDPLCRYPDKDCEDGKYGHYEYGVFESEYNLLVSSFDNERDATSFIAGYKDGAPNADLYLRKRLVMVWEPAKEDEE